ncbi:MAG: macro domain-containing protein [Fusobacteria bacterium]|nr:macro domain-containing protein [Fusobacteriota bacterium]
MDFLIIKGDLINMEVDAIVNSANTELLVGGGVCGSIFRDAGKELLGEECKKLAPINTGEAVLTPGFNLRAKYIIHTVGPIYDENKKEDCENKLRKSYYNSMQLAVNYSCKTIAFPLISSGIYGYPKTEAFLIAKSEIEEFVKKNKIKVYLVIYEESDYEKFKKILELEKN